MREFRSPIVRLIWIACSAGLTGAAACAQSTSAPASQQTADAEINIPWRSAGGEADGAPASQPASAPASAPAAGAANSSPAGPLLRLRELSFDIGAEADWHRRHTFTGARGAYATSYGQNDKAQRIEEIAGVHAAGDLGGERFCRFTFDVRGGFVQERYAETRPGLDLHDSPDGSKLEYDGRAMFFPAGRITANVYASKLDDRVPRMFLPSLERERERYGAEVLFNDSTLPMRLAYEDTFEHLQSFTRSLEDDEQHGDRRLSYEATYQPSDQHQTRFTYEYDDSRERYSGTDTRFDRVRNYLTLNDTFKFGPDDRSRLDTLVRYQDESGSTARDVAELSPQLRLQHTDTLATTYRAQLLKENYDGVELRHYRGEVGLLHDVGDWLSSSASAYGVTDQADRGGDTTEWGGLLTSAFNRDNELGRFSANVTYNHAWQRVDAATNDGIILNEALTLRDPLPATLSHTDVRRFSILVTDADSKRSFQVGRDYEVLQAGRYTMILRIPNGRITDGQTVLVSYRYRVAQGLELNRDRADWRIQQAFKNGWTPYYAGSFQVEDIDRTHFLSYEPRDVNRHRIGADYRERRWSAGAEYEYNDDAIDPYSAAHLRADAIFYQKAPHELATRESFSFYHFTGGARSAEEHDVSLLDMGLTYRYQFAERLEGNAAAVYRFEHDSLIGTTHGVDLSGSLSYKLGQFTASVEVEYNRLNLPGSNDGNFAAWIKLRRDIPIIGGRN